MLLSLAGTDTIAIVLAWFILPEVACPTPAEIDEMYVIARQAFPHLRLLHLSYSASKCRFNKRVPLRKV